MQLSMFAYLALAFISCVCAFIAPVMRLKSSARLNMLDSAPYEDIIPFLSEHVQPSDQLLFLGCSTDMCLQLVKHGYGTVQTGCMTVLDSDAAKVSMIDL
mgnify:CR=1 FL=1